MHPQAVGYSGAFLHLADRVPMTYTGIMIRLGTALLFFSCLLAGAARAGDIKVGATSLHLTPQPGYCELDVVKASDARLVAAITGLLGRTGNRLLAISADCDELREWRAGKRPGLDHMAQYQTLLGLENDPLPTAPSEAIKNACNRLRAQGEQQVEGMTLGLKAYAERVLKTVKVNETKFVAVVAEDSLVCYAALLQKFEAQTGGEKIRAITFATMVLRDKVIYSYLIAPYVDGNTLTQMLAKLRANVAKLQAANRN
jgi:hypothetical protein